jgi:amidase
VGGTLQFDKAVEIGARIRSRELTSVQVTQLMLDRIEKIDSRLGAFQRVTVDYALARAELADREIAGGRCLSPLHGVPIAIKDLLDTKNIETCYGMPVHSGHVPASNATVVQRLEDAGTVLLGKLTLTEGAFAQHHPEIAPPVNPWNDRLWSGVSSSGSGVATAAGLCYASLGTDTGGSIRFPSAANGIVGLKPTWGRVSRSGTFPLAYSLDHIGPMTRSVDDAAMMLGLIAGHDPLDPTSSRRGVPDYTDYIRATAGDLKDLRIGIDEAYLHGATNPQFVDAVAEVRALLESLGCRTVPVEVQWEGVCRGWMTTTSIEALHAHRETFPSQSDRYGPTRGLLEYGQSLDAEAYMKVELERRSLLANLDEVFEKADFILCPSMTFYAQPREGEEAEGSGTASPIEAIKFTAPFNYSGHPTLSIPWRMGDQEVPLGIQLIGRHFEEALILSVGRTIEDHREPIGVPDHFPG